MDIDEERVKIGKFIKAGLFGLSFVLLVGCGFLYLPKAIATFKPAKKEQKQPINSVECKEKAIGLSFDVTGEEKNVEEILKVLKAHSVQAAFFVTGDWAKEHPSLVKSIFLAGHDIGNHGKSKKEMVQLSKKECMEEIAQAHNQVKDLTGVDMKLFRAPYGEFNDTVLAACETLGYLPIKWNIDSMDWKNYGKDSIVNTVCNNKNLQKGSIVLCHSQTKFTKDALAELIETLQEKGYSFVKVSEMVYQEPYEIDEQGRQIQSFSK